MLPTHMQSQTLHKINADYAVSGHNLITPFLFLLAWINADGMKPLIRVVHNIMTHIGK